MEVTETEQTSFYYFHGRPLKSLIMNMINKSLNKIVFWRSGVLLQN